MHLPLLFASGNVSGLRTAKYRSRLMHTRRNPERYSPNVRKKAQILHAASPALHETVVAQPICVGTITNNFHVIKNFPTTFLGARWRYYTRIIEIPLKYRLLSLNPTQPCFKTSVTYFYGVPLKPIHSVIQKLLRKEFLNAISRLLSTVETQPE